MIRTTRALRRAFNARLATIGLTMTQASLLSFVNDHDSLTQRELADLLQITRASAGAYVDALEKRQLLRRTSDQNDRRVWRIELLPDAYPLVEGFQRIDGELRRELRAGLDRDERRTLARLLSVLEANADNAAARAEESGTV